MKIAMFTDAYYPRINGVAVSVKSYAEELSKMGHKICIVCPDYTDNYIDPFNKERLFKTYHYEYQTDASKEMKILRIPSDKIFFSKEDRNARLTQYRRIKKEMDAFNPDVIHINSEFTMGWYAIIYSRSRKIPVAYTFHTLWEDYISNYIAYLPAVLAHKIGKKLVTFYLKRADEIIVPTKRIASMVEHYGIKKETDILPTGIQKEILHCDKKIVPQFISQLYKILPLKKKNILLYVGRIVKEKNLDFLFDVLPLVRQKFPDTVLLFVGGGPELENLKSRAKKLPYSWNICFAGYRKREELAYFYNISDIFVFPSLTETQGLVTIEAMMSGLPVVAIGEMGTTDVMQGDHGGFMVKNDVKDFAEKVIELLENKELYKEKCAEAKKWSSQWAMSSLAPKLLGFYEKAINEHKKKEENQNDS